MDDTDCDNTQRLTPDPAASFPSTLPIPRDPTLECAICLQAFVQPVQLPCSHIFCFLCVKGIALQRQRCALCRADIPAELITKPAQFQAKHKVKVTPVDRNNDPDRYVWYYQGHKGWWQYDERTSAEIEEAYSKKEKSIDILIAGAIYVIDFEVMVQYQRNTNSRKRKIKRDSITAQKKGVAGMTASAPTQSNSVVPGTSGGDSAPHMVTRSSSLRQTPLGDGSAGAT